VAVQGNGKKPIQNVAREQNARINEQKKAETTAKPRIPKQPTPTVSPPPKKKKSKLKIILFIIVLIIVGVIILAKVSKKEEKPTLTPSEIAVFQDTTGREAIDSYIYALNSGEKQELLNILGESWVAKEFDYIGSFTEKEQFIEQICNAVSAEYPPIVEEEVAPDNIEILDLVIPDYAEIAELIKADSENIKKLYAESGYNPKDYEFAKEMSKLFVNWFVNNINSENLPLKTVQITPNIQYGEGAYLIDDIAFDKVLFSSEDFKKMLDSFGEVISEKSAVSHTWIGVYFVQNEYTGGDVLLSNADGSKEYPAEIGTQIITKMRCDDDKYHDVKVTLKGVWMGDEAVDYAQALDTRNVGVVANGVKKTICFEIDIENLESKTITPFASDSLTDTSMIETFLSDSYGNVGVRVGTLYGFKESGSIKPGETVTFKSWCNSADIDMKYFCWGKSFERKHPVKWFKILAGNPENANTEITE
jgi:hypothetical protein